MAEGILMTVNTWLTAHARHARPRQEDDGHNLVVCRPKKSQSNRRARVSCNSSSETAKSAGGRAAPAEAEMQMQAFCPQLIWKC